MPRAAALALALLALAACDSDPVASDDLAGSWRLVANEARDYVTVTTTQTVLDQNGTLTGAVTLTGSETASLPYLHYARNGPDNLIDLNLGSYPADSPTFPMYQLRLSNRPYNTSAELTVNDGNSYWSYRVVDWSAPSFSRSGWTLTMNGAELVSQDGQNRRVRAQGAITLPTRVLTAGQESVLTEYTIPLTPAHIQTTYVLEPDGTFRLLQQASNRTVERSGTWERTADQVVFTLPMDEIYTETTQYDVHLDGSDMILTNPMTYACDAVCLRSTESERDLLPGTLTAFRIESSLRFSPEAEVAAALDAGTNTTPLPDEIRERVLMSPSPTR